MSDVNTPVLIKFAETRRKNVLESISNEQRLQLRIQTFSKFLFSFVPNLVSCTLLFPLLKMRIISQTQCMQTKNVDINFKADSFKYWYKGSLIQTYLICAKAFCNSVLIERYQYLIKVNSTDGFFSRIKNTFYFSLLASTLSGLITYPFELSLTRACVLNDLNLKRPRDYLNLKDLTIPIKMGRYYEKFSIYFFENTLNGFALLTFYSIYNKINNDVFLSKFFLSFFAALSASVISYPINTISKCSQVGGLNNFNTFVLKDVEKQLLYK